ncbi:MAG TPA: hypothetical protein VF412_07320 [Bdellovibrio sp.]|uniref:hypothetical protein n=1 Tax=Bdellovibrio sp. TaxID=28201 RepID=UPI002F1B63BE
MKTTALKFAVAAAFLLGPTLSPAQGPSCHAVFSFSAQPTFSWQNHHWPLPTADGISLELNSLERLEQIGATPLKLLKESPLKDVYLVDWHGKVKVAKVYKASSIEKLNQTLQRDYLMGEVLPLMNIQTARLQIESTAIHFGTVLQDYHPQIAAQISDIRTQPFWGLLMRQVVALEMNKDFKDWLKNMRPYYRNLEVDFRADNIALESDGQGGWGQPVFIDW